MVAIVAEDMEWPLLAQSVRTCTIPTQALDFLVFECCPWRVPEADRQPVVGIHHADRDREIDQFLFLKDCARGLERFIRHAGLYHAGHRFGPGERGVLAVA